jgi:DNA repair protein RecN (Recombination protein N)
MLEHLSIKNFALIERLEIRFDSGLNMLTGETGSGKSIILGALALLLGERAETRVVQDGMKKCVLEGTFLLEGLGLQPFFHALDLDYEDHTQLRREVLSNGKSRAFVNDTPVNLKTLKELGTQLVDIHSQHQTLQINDPTFQLNVIDNFADTRDERMAYQALYQTYLTAHKELIRARESAREGRNELEFIRFQASELQSANLDDLDEALLEEQYNMLSNAEEITSRLSAAIGVLSEGEMPVVQGLRQVRDHLNSLSNFSKSYAELSDRLKSSIIELDDISGEMDALLGKVEADPAQLMAINETRNALFRLEQKHLLTGVRSLIEKRDELLRRLDSEDNAEERILKLESDLKETKERLDKAGLELHKKRMGSIDSFSSRIEEQLKTLNMVHARFAVELELQDAPMADGYDRIVMRFSANAGRKPEPLKHVASGGELSRLMLAIKRLSVQNAHRTTIVFDEIDTGVSGEVANSMGKIMKEMSEGLQVICITHLPQIAAKGTAHFKVFKTDEDQVSKTQISRLDEEARVLEIAQMLSGAKTTDAALANARDLLYLN